MKKILMALAMIGMAYSGAEAQTTDKESVVCRKSSGKAVSCYVTEYAENFKVCKGENGYMICGEKPNANNSTLSPLPVIRQTSQRQYTGEDLQNADITPYTPDNVSAANVPTSMVAPQSQSYSGNYDVLNSSSYEGYYPQTTRRKPCKNTDNVATANQAPYNGCPSPQSDGPDKNRQRNLNVSNPEPQPPITGGK